MFYTFTMIMFISVVGGFVPPFPQEPRVGIDDIVIPKYLNSCQACTITPLPPTYLERERIRSIIVKIDSDYTNVCTKQFENQEDLCPSDWQEIHADPINFVITNYLNRHSRSVNCIKKVICRSP